MPTEKSRICIVITSHAAFGATGRKTGYNLEELAVPYLEFKKAGLDIVLASPLGGAPPLDPGSTKAESPAAQEFLEDPEAHRRLQHTLKLSALIGGWDALFFPGGHGPMWDLASSAETTRLVEAVWRDGGVVGALCHGVAALVNAKDAHGEPLVRGKRVNSFTDLEERTVGLDGVVPFLLEARLRALGAKFECSPPFKAHATRDGRLVTGQNPASAKAVAQELLRALETKLPDVDLGERVMEMGSEDGAVLVPGRAAPPPEAVEALPAGLANKFARP